MKKHLIAWMALAAFVGCSRVEPTPPAKALAKTDLTPGQSATPTTTPATPPGLEKHTTLRTPQVEDPLAVKGVDLGSTRVVVAGDKIAFERDDPFATPTHLLFWATAVYSNDERFPVGLVLVRMPPKSTKGVSSSRGSKGDVRKINTPDGPREAGEWRFSCLGGDPLVTLQHVRHNDEVRDTWTFAGTTGTLGKGRVLLVDPHTKKVEEVSAELTGDWSALGLKAGPEEEQKKAEDRLRTLLGNLRDKHPLARDFLAPR